MNRKRMAKRFWQKSKSSIIIVVSAAILVELVAEARYWYTHQVVKEGVEQRAISDLRVKDMEIHISMNSVQTVVSDYAIDLWRSYSKPNSPDSLYYLLGQLVCNYPQISGAFCMFEPNYFPNQGYWFEPFAVREATVEDKNNYKVGKVSQDYTQWDRYAIPMRTDSAYWCEPYFDEGGRQQMITSCSVPIYDHQGKKAGVMGVDITLAGLAKTLEDEYIYPSSFFVLLSSDGKYLAGKDSLDAEVIGEIKSKNHGIEWYTNAKGEEKVVFFSKVEGPTDWKIAIVCSKKEIYRELQEVDIVLIVVGLLGFLLLAFIIVHTIRNLKRLMAADSERERIQSDLELAGKIQNNMIFRDFPAFPERQDMDIYGYLLPAKAVGGDLYQFLLRDEKLFFCIGDVSGKGVPAALFMTATCSIFHMAVSQHSAPEHIITDINTSLLKINKSNLYVTLFVGVLDLPTGRLRYCNAGHNPPLLNGELLPVVPNFPVGLLDDQRYQAQETLLTPESTLFLYTDGLTEAWNEQHQMYGEQRMCEAVQQASTASVRELVEHLTSDVQRFVDGYEQSDDLTMLALRYTPQHKESLLLQRTITLQNQLSEIPRMTTFIREVLEDIGLDEHLAMTIRLAVEEAVVNIIQYAYNDKQEGSVILCMTVTEQWLEIVLTDQGIPFDPTERPAVDIEAPLEERQVGGLGIHFMRQLMDSINYERINGQNVLTLRKHISQLSTLDSPLSTLDSKLSI